MKWHKKGLIYVPNGDMPWAKTHAMIPTPELIGDRFRIYITCCDSQKIGRIGYIEVSAENPSEILAISKEPVLDIGIPGTFDENGILVTSIVNLPDNTKYLYYVGFELGHKIRYRLLSGLAQSFEGGKSFSRARQTPILERSDKELYFRCGPFVIFDDGKFKMWYIAGSDWIELNGVSKPVYSIKYMESADGINWPDEGKNCIDVSKPDEYGFGRPYVIKEDGLYKIFYSIRDKQDGYKLGYAESLNGLDWDRKDEEIGIQKSSEGWDSEMICYSAVVKYKDKVYLFYNGNNFGASGFGYAVLE